MQTVVFSDLDETLVRSARRHPWAEDWTAAAQDRVGHTVSWQSDADRAFLTWLSAAARIIAVTGRSIGAYRRVSLPLRDYAIVHHGAVILDPAGQVEIGYRQEVWSELCATSGSLQSIADQLEASSACSVGKLRVTRQLVDGVCVEVCVKAGDLAAAEVGPEATEIVQHWRTIKGLRVHHNGNNLALLPATVDKARALRWLQQHLRRQIGSFVSIGVGDSDSDASFLAQCDYVVLPRHAQIASALWRRG